MRKLSVGIRGLFWGNILKFELRGAQQDTNLQYFVRRSRKSDK